MIRDAVEVAKSLREQHSKTIDPNAIDVNSKDGAGQRF